MKLLKLIALMSFSMVLSGTAFACEPTKFPQTQQVAEVIAKEDEGLALTSSEEFLLKSFEEDQKKYSDLYNQVYPCSFVADSVSTINISVEDANRIRQELLLLERKWQVQGVTASNVDINRSGDFVDVPDDQMYIME